MSDDQLHLAAHIGARLVDKQVDGEYRMDGVWLWMDR